MNLPVMAGRDCGDCTACCVVIGVSELGKPYFQKCRKLRDDGCGKYNSRPMTCRTFTCPYLAGVTHVRPNVAGLLIAPDLTETHIDCFETRPGGWNDPVARSEAIRIAGVFTKMKVWLGITVWAYGEHVPIRYAIDNAYEDPGVPRIETTPLYWHGDIEGAPIFRTFKPVAEPLANQRRDVR